MPKKFSESAVAGRGYWLNLARDWRKVKPPVKPSLTDLKSYDEFLKRALKHKKSPKILVLGATPEMRDLADKYTQEVTVVDLNLEMILAMTGLMKRKNPKEIWVKGNWLNVPLRCNYYDAILGDGITTNISWKEANQFWKHSKELLKEKGIFITRIFYMISFEEIKKFAHRIFKKITRDKIVKLTDFAKLKLTLEALSYSRKTKRVATKNYKDLFLKWAKEYSLSQQKIKKVYQDLIKIYPSSPPKSWRAPTQTENEREIRKYFNIISEVKDYFIPFISIYLLKKK